MQLGYHSATRQKQSKQRSGILSVVGAEVVYH